ncbi:MAG: 3-hydroxyacyl-CoA dehydrogenase family protein, partial [Trichloromonadaceae bacterium]
MRQIKRVAVLGAGVMGATIGAHLANAGLEVLLLDMVPKDLKEGDTSPAARNRFALKGLQGAVQSRPAAFFRPDAAALVQVGNFDDDMAKLRDCDWVIEVVVENLAIKQKLFAEKVVPNLTPGAILSTNTSGLSVNSMAESLPPEVRRNFLVTHFFNPPRYMRLLEIVPCSDTDPAIVSGMADFLSRRLGKGIVYAKDTPNFIANRIGVYSIFKAVQHMQAMGMTVEEVDAVAGPATARPKSAAFRTADLVGIDTLVHVGNNSYQLLPNDEEREVFKVPPFITAMVDKGLLGNKSKQGFYRKDQGDGKTAIFYFDYASGDYLPAQKPKFASLEAVKQVDDPRLRVKMVLEGHDKAAEFAWKNLRDTLIYTINRIPEIAGDIVNIDNAMRWGFNWEIGPFEMLDAIGVAAFVARAKKDEVQIPASLEGVESFYKFQDGKKLYFDLASRTYLQVPL